MPRPIVATIDLPALRHNLAAARARAGHRRVWAVVKANAYGHGIERAVRACGAADGLALLDLAEAERARSAGWPGPILLLEGCFAASDVAVVQALGLTTVVHGPEQLAWVERAADAARAPIAVVLKLNSGMNRLGFSAAAAGAAYARLKAHPRVQLQAVAMHFANADRADAAAAPLSLQQQALRFEALTAGWPEARSMANSAALFLHPPRADDWVRPGIALYGGTPCDAPAARLGLRAVMHLRSRVIAVQPLRPGDAVGYGSRFVAPRPLRIGVVACGYADGYPRHAPDGTPVLVDGVPVTLAGRVSMDMLTVDLTAAPQAQVGSAVELWGSALPIDTVAAAAGTVGYELMCALAPRVPVEVLE